MKIHMDLLQMLRGIFAAIPLRTPNRMEIIEKYATSLSKEYSVTNLDDNERSKVLIDCHNEMSYENNSFLFCSKDLMFLEQNLPNTICLFKMEDFPLILLPEKNFCCGKLLSLQKYHANVTVYKLTMVTDARSYHCKCKLCGITYCYGFSEEKSGKSLLLGL